MIMITTFDPFGEDGIIYTFENTCKEYPHIENRDGLKYIYFNVTGRKGGTEAIKQLLSYLNDSKIENVTNDNILHIHNYVTSVKQSAEVRDRYMTIGEMMDMSKAEGEQIGLRKALLNILEDLGPIPENFDIRLQELDENTLKQWTKLAARAESMEEFVSKI